MTPSNSRRLYLGIDVGTTGTKAVVIDLRGVVHGRGYAGYQLSCPAPGHAIQDARDWRDAVITSTRAACANVDKREIVALAVAAQGATLVATDARHEPLGPARSWLDRRATGSAAALEAGFGADDFYRRTGWPISSNNTAPQLLDLATNAAEEFAAASHFCDTAAFLNGWLTGTATIDWNVAGISLMMNLDTRAWDEDILTAIGVDPDRLPAIASPGTRIGALTGPAAIELGLCPGIVVGAGAQDQYCAALGADAASPGDMMVSTGTAWVMLVAAAERFPDPAAAIGCGRHIGQAPWGHFGEISNGGSSVEWARRLLTHGHNEPFAISDLDSVLAETTPGAAGLSFYPFFDGTGLPDGASTSSASLLGLGLSHRSQHLLRAVTEGVVFALRMLIDRYDATTDRPRKPPTVVGGATRSPRWMRILADVLNQDLHVSSDPDVACIGAAALAATAIGDASTATAAAAAMTPSKSIVSSNASSSRYEELFSLYQRNAHALDELAATRNGLPRKEIA